jgi:serine/threonine protein kinase/Flp pilus assembly protein TadD
MAVDTMLTSGQGAPEDTAWADRLVDEVIQGWHQGEPACAQDVMEREPGLAEHAEAAVRLIYEEFCLRCAAGEPLAVEDILHRFPQWRAQLEVLLQLHSLLDLESTAPTWPVVGEDFGEFRLLAEFGRGGQGRVYLASQAGLANRPVVLKLMPCSGQEHQVQARLQHTHIVPLYTIVEDASRNLRALCMPYFGGAGLHELLSQLQPTPPQARSGQDLLDALDLLQARWPVAMGVTLAPRGAARTLLARLSYGQAICWVGALLADALDHAHERGLVHLDVKPSNVLLTADGQPMLLDFHIAQGPLQPHDPAPERLGGTPIYASPEQRAAMEALRHGQPMPSAVDGRSDIYSLGLLLCEALSGSPTLGSSPQPRLRLPHVSTGLADILSRCLAVQPGERYASAAGLAEDLRRHLNDLPLRGVANRSVLERWRKWRRRRPSSLAFLLTALAVLSAVLAVASLTWGRYRHRKQEAEQALAEGRQQLHAGAYSQAAERLSHGLSMAQGVPWGAALMRELSQELRRAQRGQAVLQLHALAERFRFLCGGLAPEGKLSSLRPLWTAVWDKRDGLLDRQEGELPPEVEEQLRTDLFDLGVIWADLSVRLAEPGQRAGACRAALAVLDTLEKQLGPSGAVCYQRQACAAELGLDDVASAAGSRAAELPPRSAWEHYVLGRALLQTGDLKAALAALNQASELQPQAFWPQFHRGVCAQRLGRHEEAAHAFEVCIALAPDKAECWCNRGVALAALGRYASALRDYQRALQLNPRLGAAILNRGLLHCAQKDYEAALADWNLAVACGVDPQHPTARQLRVSLDSAKGK